MAIVVRLVAVVVLVAGPWTDQPGELSGWDAERFQAIVERDGAAWAEHPVEYPPGSVVALDLLAGPDVVSTNRTLIVVSAVFEMAAVAALWLRLGARTAKAFLILGLPLVPMGLMRLDMLVTVLATTAAIALLGRPSPMDGTSPQVEEVGPIRSAAAGQRFEPTSPSKRPSGAAMAGALLPTLAFALLAAAGAMVKIWPALLVAGAVAVRRWGAAGVCSVTMAVMGLSWLGYVGAGLDPLDQVLSLRGATGWHVESLPGSVVSLLGDGEPRLELNAFRVGDLNRSLVTVGRVLAVAMIAVLAFRAAGPGRRRPDIERLDIERLGLVMLGSVAALLVTAPLLSPQFLLWLTPWAAIVMRSERPPGPPLALTVVAIVLTGVTLTVFGPQRLGQTVPALLLLVRNLALLAIAPVCYRSLSHPAAGAGSVGGTAGAS